METVKADKSCLLCDGLHLFHFPFSGITFFFLFFFWWVMTVSNDSLCCGCPHRSLGDEGSAGRTREELPVLVGHRGHEPNPQRHGGRLSHLLLCPAARRGRRAQRVSAHLLQVGRSECFYSFCPMLWRWLKGIVSAFWKSTASTHTTPSAKCAEVSFFLLCVHSGSV